MSVKDFFKGKHIFITGGSGFIGKVLIEKLLRSYNGVEKIYVLLRMKKGKSSEERLKSIVDNVLFEKLKQIDPDAIKKLVPICGDVTEIKLGLSTEDMQTIIENVDIIYHGAASVRFDDHLKDSVLLNTRGTKELVDIALQGKKLITFLHISTSYCNADKKYVEERIYPAHADWRNTITLAEQADERVLSALTMKYIYPLPNTYTFSKSLSEHVVNDLCQGKILAVIVRPSIVISTYNDPFCGFVDNFNGPIGLLTAGGKGLLRICYGKENTALDFMPVDFFVKFLILITYEKTLSKNLNEVSVYNTTTGTNVTVTNRDIIELGSKLNWDAPFSQTMWYPRFSITNCWYKYYIMVLLYHMIPAIFLDGLLKLSGNKPMLIKIQRKIYIANMALEYFMQNSWVFVNHKCIELSKNTRDFESLTFSYRMLFEVSQQEVYTYYLKGKIATGEVLLKEKFNRKEAFRKTLIFWIMDCLLHITIIGFLIWCFIVKFRALAIFTNLVNRYIDYLSRL